MSLHPTNPQPAGQTADPAAPGAEDDAGTGLHVAADGDAGQALRDIAEVPAVEVVTTVALHLMSAAAVKCGLGEEGDEGLDLDEARTLITALAGLVVTSAPDLGSFHARPLRDGLRTLQLAFREASAFPDPPGQGPGERLTGPVS